MDTKKLKTCGVCSWHGTRVMVDVGGEGTQDTQVSFLTSTMGLHEDGVAAPMSHFREICARRNRGLPSQLPSEADP